MLSVNFVLPFVASRPGGGVKIMYEYANRLAEKGHKVTLYHSIRRPFKKSRTPIWLRYFINALRPRSRWFTFRAGVTSKVVPEISDKYVLDADATVSTWWQMTFALAELSAGKGKKINLIQDYEVWTGQVDLVHQSYRLPVQHVVIASYLQQKVHEFAHTLPLHIPNAVDTSRFCIKTAPEQRNPYSVIMLFSTEPRKGSSVGIDALEKARAVFGQLTATLFSVFDRPGDLPSWIKFQKQPEDLQSLYNSHAIFISPSLGEGWALPPAEAMACGCAVVCTDIGGHHDYAVHDKTALLVDRNDPAALASSIVSLLLDPDRRQRLALGGSSNIRQQFNWTRSVDQLEQVIQGQ
jgi:glycosyltransferase involved in cell wall biosynthesis